jgi:hypothetical protein
MQNQSERRSFASIGRFIFEFSQLEFTIKHLLSLGLDLREGQFHIVTTGYDFATLLCKAPCGRGRYFK